MVEGPDGSEGRQFEIKGFQFSEILRCDITKLHMGNSVFWAGPSVIALHQMIAKRLMIPNTIALFDILTAVKYNEFLVPDACRCNFVLKDNLPSHGKTLNWPFSFESKVVIQTYTFKVAN